MDQDELRFGWKKCWDEELDSGIVSDGPCFSLVSRQCSPQGLSETTHLQRSLKDAADGEMSERLKTQEGILKQVHKETRNGQNSMYSNIRTESIFFPTSS